MVLSFKGTAHPPPRGDGRREHSADLSRAEISSLRMGNNGGVDVLVEHDHSARVGKVLASWEGPRGELRVEGIINDGNAESQVRSGSMRGLSLGTGVTYGPSGGVLLRAQDELSICEEPRRGGCFIDELNGSRVRKSANFSAGAPCISLSNKPSLN